MNTYKIVRYYQSDDWVPQVIDHGLSLEQAQAHCEDPETSSATATNPSALARTTARGPWFEGYTEENR